MSWKFVGGGGVGGWGGGVTYALTYEHLRSEGTFKMLMFTTYTCFVGLSAVNSTMFLSVSL